MCNLKIRYDRWFNKNIFLCVCVPEYWITCPLELLIWHLSSSVSTSYIGVWKIWQICKVNVQESIRQVLLRKEGDRIFFLKLCIKTISSKKIKKIWCSQKFMKLQVDRWMSNFSYCVNFNFRVHFHQVLHHPKPMVPLPLLQATSVPQCLRKTMKRDNKKEKMQHKMRCYLQ